MMQKLLSKCDQIFSLNAWSIWAFMALLKGVSLLPFSIQTKLAPALTPLVMKFGKRRLKVCRINLEKVYPEWSREERARRLRACFDSFVLGAIETNVGYWASSRRFLSIFSVEIEGMEHLQKALALGKGVIVCGYHFHLLEIASRLIGEIAKLNFGVESAVVYQPHKNPLMNQFLIAWRSRYGAQVFRRKELKKMLVWLKAGKLLLYAPDQDLGAGPSVFAPFMGIQAATVSATSRIIQHTGATLIPGTCVRKAGKMILTLLPPLENYPSGDEVHDATRLNAIYEKVAREYPEQYLWQHRRFKTRPEGEASFYE